MTTPRTLWSDTLPRYSAGVARLRHRVALDACRSGGLWRNLHGRRLRFEIAAPLPSYPLWLDMKCALGTLKLGLDAAAVYPEISRDVIGCWDVRARRQMLEWLLMPWLDRFESLTGCECWITEVSPHPASPLSDSVPLRVLFSDGGMLHAALSGSAMDYLADALGMPLPPPPDWCRVAVTWVLRVEALSRIEMNALTKGAMLLLSPVRLHACMDKGALRMQAHWKDDDVVAIDGPGESKVGASRLLTEEALVDVDALGFDIDVVLATERLTLDQVRGLCKGAVLALSRPVDGQRVSLASHGDVFARGHIVYVGDAMAVMITECKGVRA